MTSSNARKQQLRKHLRERRKALSAEQQDAAAHRLLEQFQAFHRSHSVTRIGAFIANDGEINPHLIIKYCWSTNIDVALPVLDPNKQGHLLFVDYSPNCPMHVNQYGIPEPVLTDNNQVNLSSISHLLMPLVGFDPNGHRLGMGGGYYDRTLAQQGTSGPQLVGVAHEEQMCESLPVEPWDIPLQYILTSQRYWSFSLAT